MSALLRPMDAQRLHDEAAGVVSTTVLLFDDLPNVAALAREGDQEAERLAVLAARQVQRINNALESAHALCRCCLKRLQSTPYSIVVTTAMRDDPQCTLVFAIGHCCASSRAEVEDKAHQVLAQVWPDLRRLDVHPSAEGRA